MNTLEQVSARPISAENSLWRNELIFFKDEIKVLRQHLLEVAGKTHHPDAAVGTEHFQNQFVRQEEVLHELKNDVKMHERRLSEASLADGEMEGHDSLRDRIETFRKIYGDLKNEFMEFLGKWM